MRFHLPAALAVSTLLSIVLGRDTDSIRGLPPERNVYRARATSTASSYTLLPTPTSIPSSPPSPTPTPLDLAISYSLSDSCLLFLTSALKSPAFLSCLPFSLLLTTSTSYTSLTNQALSSGNYSTLNTLLAYISHPPTECNAYMAGLWTSIANKGNCAADLAKSNAIATEAKAGLGNYKVMQEAAGLVDETTGSYCYMEALANLAPDDLYLWQLPSGIALPSSSTPSCSQCSASLLSHLLQNVDSTSALNGTIISNAANVVNSVCGNTFVAYSAKSTSGAQKKWTMSILLVVLWIWSSLWNL